MSNEITSWEDIETASKDSKVSLVGIVRGSLQNPIGHESVLKIESPPENYGYELWGVTDTDDFSSGERVDISGYIRDIEIDGDIIVQINTISTHPTSYPDVDIESVKKSIDESDI